jgi:hypothetical protein
MDKTRKVLHRSRIATFLVVQSQIKAVGGHKKDPGSLKMPGFAVSRCCLKLLRLLDRAAGVSGMGTCRSAGLLRVKIRPLVFGHKLQLF